MFKRNYKIVENYADGKVRTTYISAKRGLMKKMISAASNDPEVWNYSVFGKDGIILWYK